MSEMLFSGGIAVDYVLVVRGPRWLPLLVLAHISLSMELAHIARTAPLAGPALNAAASRRLLLCTENFLL